MKLCIVFFLAAIGVNTYGQLRNLSLKSYDIVSYNFVAGRMTLDLTVSNDTTDFTLNSFYALIYQHQDSLLSVTAENILIPHGISTIRIPFQISRCKGISILRLFRCLVVFHIRDYSADVAVSLQYPDAIIQRKERKGIPLERYYR